MMQRARACVVLAVLVAVGICAGVLAISDPDVRRLARLSPDVPNPLVLAAAAQPVDPRVIPLDVMGARKGPNPFQRTSWEGIEHRPPPRDPRTDPRRGSTQAMYFHPRLEMRLSSALRRGGVTCKVLRVGIALPGTPRAARPATGGGVCSIEIYCGSPAGRHAVEESVDRAVQVAFDTLPMVDEVDVVAVPWRTVQGKKPPVRYSVSARREMWFGVSGARSHAENLRTCGAVWCDPHVMSGCPPPASAR